MWRHFGGARAKTLHDQRWVRSFYQPVRKIGSVLLVFNICAFLIFTLLSTVSIPPHFSGKTLESLDPSLFTKNKPGKGGSNVKEREKQKEIAALEAQVYRFSGKNDIAFAACQS